VFENKGRRAHAIGFPGSRDHANVGPPLG
jgi:hypothetical protein